MADRRPAAVCPPPDAAGPPGTLQDTAHMVEFICSPEGGWMNGQFLMSNDGFS